MIPGAGGRPQPTRARLVPRGVAPLGCSRTKATSKGWSSPAGRWRPVRSGAPRGGRRKPCESSSGSRAARPAISRWARRPGALPVSRRRTFARTAPPSETVPVSSTSSRSGTVALAGTVTHTAPWGGQAGGQFLGQGPEGPPGLVPTLEVLLPVVTVGSWRPTPPATSSAQRTSTTQSGVTPGGTSPFRTYASPPSPRVLPVKSPPLSYRTTDPSRCTVRPSSSQDSGVRPRKATAARPASGSTRTLTRCWTAMPVNVMRRSSTTAPLIPRAGSSFMSQTFWGIGAQLPACKETRRHTAIDADIDLSFIPSYLMNNTATIQPGPGEKNSFAIASRARTGR